MNEQGEILPQIRQDLAILNGGAGWLGEPNWLIHDRIRNRYFRISAPTVELLRIWQPVEADILAEHASEKIDRTVTKEEILQLAQFLFANSLSTTPASGDYSGYLSQSLAGKKSWWMALVHNYLFFRIPLARPQKFLDYAWPFVQPLFTRRAAIIFTFFAVLGLYLVSRQWQVFLTTFASFLTLEGFALYAFSLVFVKALHELGHAFMAKRYHVEVPTIGAAFIVMMPILYTDTSSAWRLANKNHRLMIDLAGIFTELAIASICTIAWVFLPDGNLRAIAFTTATLSWVLSLSVNLNPFMKFDGYYILSDMLGFENLQERGFALARWWLREKLFGLQILPPEHLNPGFRRFIIAHAIGTWIYRFFLFLAIALLVYYFFFKVLGIFLFIVEMVWFIGLPIGREIKEWWKMKDDIKAKPRFKWSLAVLAAFILFLAVPWSNTVTVPAILAQARETRLYAPYPAQVLEVKLSEGSRVKAGQLLIRFGSVDIETEITMAELEQKNTLSKLARAHADVNDRSQIQVLNSQADAINNKISGLQAKLSDLDIRSPHDGLVVDRARNIHPGRWMNGSVQLAMIRSLDQPEIKALADENARTRIKPGARGIFIPDDLQRSSFDVELTQMAAIAGPGLELAYLGDNSGSMVALQPTQDAKPRALAAWFPLRLVPAGRPEKPQAEQADNVVRGVVVLEADSQSLAERIFRRIASVLVREAGI